jgi:hypothetical protein
MYQWKAMQTRPFWVTIASDILHVYELLALVWRFDCRNVSAPLKTSVCQCSSSSTVHATPFWRILIHRH